MVTRGIAYLGTDSGDSNNRTRLHSSRMSMVRSSNHVYPSMHWVGGECPGGYLPGGCLPMGFLPRGMSAQGKGMSARGGVWPGGCIPTCIEADTPTWTEWLTDRCKNITFRNFVCRRYKYFLIYVISMTTLNRYLPRGVSNAIFFLLLHLHHWKQSHFWANQRI